VRVAASGAADVVVLEDERHDGEFEARTAEALVRATPRAQHGREHDRPAAAQNRETHLRPRDMRVHCAFEVRGAGDAGSVERSEHVADRDARRLSRRSGDD